MVPLVGGAVDLSGFAPAQGGQGGDPPSVGEVTWTSISEAASGEWDWETAEVVAVLGFTDSAPTGYGTDNAAYPDDHNHPLAGYLDSPDNHDNETVDTSIDPGSVDTPIGVHGDWQRTAAVAWCDLIGDPGVDLPEWVDELCTIGEMARKSGRTRSDVREALDRARVSRQWWASPNGVPLWAPLGLTLQQAADRFSEAFESLNSTLRGLTEGDLAEIRQGLEEMSSDRDADDLCPDCEWIPVRRWTDHSETSLLGLSCDEHTQPQADPSLRDAPRAP